MQQVTNTEPLSFEKVWLMFQETDRKFQESERLLNEKFQESDRKISKLNETVSGIGHNNGAVAEEFFSMGLKAKTKYLE